MAVDVWVDFGAGSAADDFSQRVAEWSTTLNATSVTASELATLKSQVRSGLQSAYAGYTINWLDSAPATAATQLSFGRRADDVAPNRSSPYGVAPLDWLNQYADDKAYVFPATMATADFRDLTHADQLSLLAKSLTYVGVSELGRTFGLDAADAYGDPAIQPDNYASTRGIQNRHFMSEPAFGLSLEKLAANAITFSPLSRAKLDVAAGLTASPPTHAAEVEADHGTPSAAQSLTTSPLPHSGGRAAIVAAAYASTEADVYRISLAAGELLTVETLVSEVYESAPATFDSSLRILGPDGVTVVHTATDTRLSATSFGDLASPVENNDALVLNFRASTAGNYYIEVTSATTDFGFYDLLVAAWAPTTTPWRNAARQLDVDNDLFIAPVDALLVINELNRADGGARRLPNPTVGAESPTTQSSTPRYFDTSGDDFLSPIDALLVINELNRAASGSAGGQAAEGEATPDASSIDAAR
ncbi:MAG TPA: dockerin type I domain-containing protein, partial [Pirellulaceae bacterium]|nr:dockerin type I domain-containing protein [Pirellulaceae bacterium]